MKNLRINFKEWSIPIALLVLCLLSFGILIPTLGFYWDDWEGILVADQFNLSEFWVYFSGNRPLAAWTHIALTPILGVKPINWHLYTLFIRWVTVCLMWLSFCKIFPNNKRIITYSAFLFAIYPIFVQQPIAVAYHQHWTAYALYFVSIFTMILALQQPQKYWIFTPISIVSAFLNLSILEYMVGLELLRPIIIWLLSPENRDTIKKRITFVFIKWLPYIILIGGLIFWRLRFTMQAEVDPNKPSLLISLFSEPIKTLIDFTQIVIQDTLFILVSSWYKTLQPNLIQIRQPFNLLSWGFVFLVALCLYFYLSNLRFEREIPNNTKFKSMQVLLIGIAATLMGTFPIWSTYRQASGDGMYVDRFAMASMFGASILLSLLIDWLVNDQKRLILIISILVGVSTGLHLRNTNDYRWSWIKQQRVYWQLIWRAPGIEKGTSIMSNEQLFPFVSPTFSFNLLYDQPDNKRDFPYWYFNLGEFKDDMPGLIEGKQIEAAHREFTYSASSKDSLVVLYEPPFTNCLWILDEESSGEPYIPELTEQALPISDFSQILAIPALSSYPSQAIFGNEPEAGWCTYYQKAALAKQYDDWETVRILGNEALEKGFSPQNLEANSPHEWMPFIEGFAYTGDPQYAKGLTLDSYNIDNNYDVTLCNLWIRISGNSYGDVNIINASSEVFSALGCNPK